MRIGISVNSAYRVDDPRRGAQNMIERARAARQADLDSLFVGDHHVTEVPYYQNTPMLGRMLAEWHNKPVGALYLLPLASGIASGADRNVSGHRTRPIHYAMRFGLGAGAKRWHGCGHDSTSRHVRNKPRSNAKTLGWRGGQRGAFLEYRECADLAFTCAKYRSVGRRWRASRALNRTARMADGWLASPGLDHAAAAQQLNQYRQACAEFGRSPSAVAIRRDIFIAADAAEAAAFKQRMVTKGYRGFAEDAILAGTPETVAAEFATLAEMGFTDIIVRNMSADQGEALATIEGLVEVKRILNL